MVSTQELIQIVSEAEEAAIKKREVRSETAVRHY